MSPKAGVPVKHISWAEVLLRSEMIAETIRSIWKPPYILYGIPRGGIPVAIMVHESMQRYNLPSELTCNPNDATIIVDDIKATGATARRYSKDTGRPVYPLYEKELGQDEWFIFPWEQMADETDPQDNVKRILEYIGEDPDREGLKNTPSRVIKSWEKLFGGYSRDPKDEIVAFEEGVCREMVVLCDIEFYSTCEHHMMPFFGRAHIGYIPKGKVIGISKLARILEIYSRRLQTQERLVGQVTKAIMNLLRPQGCGCVLTAQHFCMMSRGVEKQNSMMTTSSLRGIFMEAPVKMEFLSFLGK